jgi:hypothetical protein
MVEPEDLWANGDVRNKKTSKGNEVPLEVS